MASVGAGAWAAAGAGAAVAVAVLPVFAAFAAVSGLPVRKKKTQDTRGEGGRPPGAKTQNAGGVGGCFALAPPW